MSAAVLRAAVTEDPIDHGFTTGLWTAKRLNHLIQHTWDVAFNHRYLCDWLHQRGYSPQKPQRVPHERNDLVIRGWCRREWPRIQKKSALSVATSFLSTKAAF